MFRRRITSLAVIFLLVGSGLLVFTPAVFAASPKVSLVQIAETGTVAGSTNPYTMTVTFANPVAANDVVLVMGTFLAAKANSVTDSGSNSYSLIQSVIGKNFTTDNSGYNQTADIAAFSGVASSTQSLSITISFTGNKTMGFTEMAAYDLSGAAASSITAVTGTGGPGCYQPASGFCTDSMSTNSTGSYSAGSFILIGANDYWMESASKSGYSSNLDFNQIDGSFAYLTSVQTSALASTNYPVAGSSSGLATGAYWAELAVAVAPLPASSTSVSCTPNPVLATNTASCTATVTGSSPSGTVSFTTNSTGGSFPSGASCTLSGGSCSVNYVDTVVGHANLTAAYSGDQSNFQSTGSGLLTVNPRPSTTTAVSCVPSPVVQLGQTSCTATVTGSSPSGTVSFSTDSPGGSFPSGASCTLSSASCAVSYNDTNAGTATLTGSYSGDLSNAPSSGTFALTVLTASSVTLSCYPGMVYVNRNALCTVSVAGTSPTGTITFGTSSATGSFSASTCTLSSASCAVNYTDTSPGSFVITGTYGGDSANSAASSVYTIKVGVLQTTQLPIPGSNVTPVINFTTDGGMAFTGTFVALLTSGQAVYNVPGLNQTLLSQELMQGDFTLFPSLVNSCATQVDGQSMVRVYGFSSLSWGGAATNSTEFVLGGWESFLTGAAGWPSLPSC